MQRTTPAFLGPFALLPVLLPALGALVAVSAIAATPVSAQMAANYRTYGDRDAPGTNSNLYFTTWPVSRAECMANEPIEVQISGAPFTTTGGALVYDLWTGGTGPAPAACQTAANRRSTTGTPPCTRVDFSGPMVAGVQQIVALPPQALFGADCDTSGDLSFFLLAVSAANDTTTDLANTHYVVLRAVIDVMPPNRPTLSDAAGDNAAAVSWTLPDSPGTLSSARLYLDTAGSCGGSSDGGTTTTTLVENATAPGTGFREVEGASPTGITVDAAALGLDPGEGIPMAVTIVDLARNESVLSNVACLTRVEVVGFWDSYCAEQGLSPEECDARYNGGCSVTPGAPSRGGWALGLSMLALSALLSRRARAMRGNP